MIAGCDFIGMIKKVYGHMAFMLSRIPYFFTEEL